MGTKLDVGARRERIPRREPGSDLVDRRHHEDRSHRTPESRVRDGLNEFGGYFAVALSALARGFIAARYGLRPQPFYLGIAFVAIGLVLSVVAVRETAPHVAAESRSHGMASGAAGPTQREIFRRTSLTDSDLSSDSQAGLVNNLNDGME